jgi:hypothetical protein
MRYFLATYIRKPDGKIDEQVEISKNLKDSDIQMCNIILDFEEKKVLKSVIQGQTVPTTWDVIVEHYRLVYPDYIDELEKMQDE